MKATKDTKTMTIEVGILGATGMVGQQFIALLAKHPFSMLYCLAHVLRL